MQRVVGLAGRFSAQAARCLSAPVRHGSWFAGVPEAPKDPILGVTEKFLADPNPHKMNLGVGAYRDDAGKPVVLECVREAERRIMGTEMMEYLPMGGLRVFCDASVQLAYGEGSPALGPTLARVQTLSGTGAVRLFADFMARFMRGAQICIPVPTWSNHHQIFADARVPELKYRYYKPETRGLDLDGMLEDLSKAKPGSVVLLHACAHNPTGVDPTLAQWAAISKLMKEKRLFPLFDSAYQGFASGDPDKDAAAVRLFVREGHAVAVAQSFAKNMGLYGQRIGCLSVMCANPHEAVAVESQLKLVARPMYSNPPLFGAKVVATVLGDRDLRTLWSAEVRVMATRIISMRTALRGALEASGSSHKWGHITEQIGMFCFSGMTGEQVDRLQAEHSIYMTRNGRISMAGVTSGGVERLAEAIHQVTK